MQLLFDFFPVIAFFVTYKVTGSIFVATSRDYRRGDSADRMAMVPSPQSQPDGADLKHADHRFSAAWPC